MPSNVTTSDKLQDLKKGLKESLLDADMQLIALLHAMTSHTLSMQFLMSCKRINSIQI